MSFNAMNTSTEPAPSVETKTIKYLAMEEEDAVVIDIDTNIDTNDSGINAFTQEEIDDMVAAQEEYERLLFEEDPNDYSIYEMEMKNYEDDPKNRPSRCGRRH